MAYCLWRSYTLFYADMYSLEYSGISCILYILSLSVWHACWPPVTLQLCKNTPFNGAGRRPAPHPLLATFPSPKAIYLYTLFHPLCEEYVCVTVCSARICKHSEKVKVPVQDAQAGRVGSLPPPPCSVSGAVVGQFGAFIWGVFISNEKDVLLSKKRNRKVMKCILVNL